MFEALALYRNLSPSTLGFLFFIVGTAFGSFGSVVYHRLQSGQSIVRPRSHCPHCRHTLGALDLIPLVSFFINRGKCRHCSAPIHWRYPLLEAASGGLSALAAATAGFGAGVACLTIVPAGTAVLALLHRRLALKSSSQAGITLVEVMAGVAILGIALMPALDTLTMARRSGRAAEERSVTMGLARARINMLAGIGAVQPAADLDTYNGLAETGQSISGDPGMAIYELETSVQPGELPNLRVVTVTVKCPTCSRLGGLPLRQISVSATVEGR